MNKARFLADLRSHIETHQHLVLNGFRPLPLEQLSRQPDAKEWSILQCFDHLNQTHAYYTPKIEAALREPAPVRARGGRASGDSSNQSVDTYAPSFWGRIYMAFSFNPRLSFPAADVLKPGVKLDTTLLDRFLSNQQQLLRRLETLAAVDLRATRVPIAGMVRFNLGDCLKILVYHDALHTNQALRVRQAIAGF